MEQIKADHFNHDITERKSSTGPLFLFVLLLPQHVLNALAVFHVMCTLTVWLLSSLAWKN